MCIQRKEGMNKKSANYYVYREKKELCGNALIIVQKGKESSQLKNTDQYVYRKKKGVAG